MGHYAPFGLWAILLLLLSWRQQSYVRADTYFKIPDPDLYPPQAVEKMDNSDMPPPGMSSLTFVFDRTGSMNDDLNQVRQGAKGIFETVMKQRKKLIHNYVLVLFHDPDVDPPFVSTDPDVFQQELASVSVQGGGDCPEMTLSGIKKALEVSLPGSYIYVFTDARSKDYHLEDRVLNLIQEKQSSVVFVMTGDCGNRTAPGYRVFEKIAAASFGQVFHLEKSHVNTVLEYVRHSVAQRKVHILYEVRELGQSHISLIPVDAHFSELTLSLSGERDDGDHLNIVLVDPQNRTVEKSSYENESGNIDLKSIKLIRIKEPQPGIWKVTTISRLKHTLRVFGHGAIDFKYGFASRPVQTVDLAHPRPIAGQSTYLLVNMTGLNPPGVVVQLSLVDYHGRELFRNETRIHKHNPYLYYVGPFMPPKGFFFVRVNGEDEHNYEFIRIAPTAISTVETTGPRAYMAERITATAYQSVNLTCSVESRTPFTVYWQYGSVVIGGPLFYKQTDTSIWTIDAVTPAHRGHYICQVVSPVGNHSAVTFLDSREPPPHIIGIRNESVILRGTAYLHCRTQSIEQAQIRWIRNGIHIGNSAKIYMADNGTLRILDSTHADAGAYTCRARNSGGHTEATVYLSIMEAPEAYVQPPEVFVALGSMFNLTCHTKGKPPPDVSWFFQGIKIVPDSKFYINYKNELLVSDVESEDIGIYECRASNPVGIKADYGTVRLAVPPEVHVTQDRQMISRGDLVVIDCRILSGIPAPTISWFKDGREIVSGRYRLTQDGRLTIRGAEESDTGTYACKAENIAGSDIKPVTLAIGSAPTLVPSPDRVQVDIEHSVTLECRAVGVPKPSIMWLKDEKTIVDFGDNMVILPDDSLLIPNVKLENKGRYTCVAKNSFGQQMKHTTLEVTGLVSPILAHVPSEMQLIEGKNLRINCIVLMGNPKPNTRWMKDGQPLEGKSASAEIQSDGSLLLRNGGESEAGKYSCEAISPAGSAVVEVDVQLIKKPTILRTSTASDLSPTEESEPEIEAVLVVLNKPSELACELVRGTEPVNIEWHRGGLPINLENDIDKAFVQITERGRKLHFLSAQRAHATRWECIAKNSAGEDRKIFDVQVNVPVTINDSASSPPIMSVMPGDQFRLDCIVDGVPQPEIRWLKDDQPLSLSDFVVLTNSSQTLWVTRANHTNDGRYQCHAENDLGNVSRNFIVKITGPPILDLGPNRQPVEDLNLLVGDHSVLKCQALNSGGITPIELTTSWLIDGRPVQEGQISPSITLDNSKIVIHSARLSDTGEYTCIVKNDAGEAQKKYVVNILERPHFMDTSNTHYSVIEGGSVALDCLVTGTPRPKITWTKDGKLLDEDFAYFINDNQQLHIEEVDERHVGRYSCVAENIPGRVEKDMLISLLKPPVMLEQTKSVEVQENETITLTCPVESTDESTQFEWSKHGMPVTQSSNLQMSSSGKLLHIMRSQTSDSGSYVCVASNEAGEDDATFDLFVLVPPSIKGPSFHQMESILNHTVQLQCVTNAIPEPDIEWFRDGQKIFSGLNAIDILKNGSVLRIIGIQTEHEGRYTCVATNKVGRAEADTFVQVIEKPRIETPSPELRVVEGRQQRLECTVMGIPPPKVEWWRNGEPMEKQKHHFSSSGNTHWIHFRNVQLSDAGRYTCIATNQGGETRQNIALNVLVPPSIADGERIMRVAEAGQLALDCVTKGHPTPEIVWKKEGIIVNATLKTRLLIVNITSDDNGRYTCEAKNEAGLATVDYVVEVLIKPRMKVHVADLRVIEGERAKLECEADGYPEPSIKWMRGGRPITDMANFILSPGGETLMILKTKRSDGGVYSCVVTNSAGEIEAPFTVTVLTAPHIEQTIDQNPRVINNNSVALDCPVLGYPEPEVIWLKDNEPVTYDLNFVKDGKNNLKIHRIAVSNKGRYTCQAKNEVGSLNTDYQLEVLAPPKFGAEGQRIFEVVEGEPATVICPVEAVPLPNIEWLRGINPIHGSDNVRISSDAKKVTIMRTTLHDGGKYTCKATNIAGSTDIDLILKVLVPPHIDKSNLINNPLGIFGKEIFLECPASGIPQPTIIWTRDGIPINFENSEEGKYSLLQGNQSFSIAKIDASDQGRYTCEVHNKGGRTSEQFSVEVLVPPQMEETEQQKLTKREGDALTLICPIKGEMLESNSELRVTWAKDGRPLESIGSPNYEITNDGRRLQLIGSSISDAGQYKCVASNRAGEAHVKFNVDILSKPVIDGSRNEPEPHIILGHPITLWCPASGNPLPKIRWYRNGIEIGQQPNHQNYRILDQGQGIEISKSADEDDGIWTCEAENAAGTSQLEIPLDVWVEPTVKVHALDNNPIKPVGSSITLFCNVSGNPTPVITWMLNDQILIPSADGTRISLSGYRLDIPRLQTEDAGDYYCIAQNEVGNTKDAIAVDILVPPLIDRDTVELNPHLPLGRTLTLFCDAKGEPTPILSWYINDTLIEDSASNNYRQNVVFGENHKFIQVPNVSLSNKGVYRCEATNSAGTDELVYKVDIFQSPTIYKGGTEQVTEGKVAILECNASGEPPPLVTWQRNGVRVETGLRYVVDDRVLKIIDTRSSDSGIYVCVATNEAGTDQQAFTLEVLIAPKLVSTSANSTVALNGNTSLRCAARGYPIPKVLWSVDDDQKPINEALVEGVEYVTDDNGAVLHLMNLKHRGNRMFNCAVVNDAGMDEIMYSVRTIAPPLITKDGVKVQNVTESETVKITCDVGHKENDYSSAGADEDETTWQKDGTTFEPDHSIQISLDQKELTFFTVQLHHAGNYSCTVKNFAGVASQYIQLNVGVPPKVSENSRKVIVKRGELAELWCEAVGIPPPKISWFKDNISLLNSDVASEGDIVSGEMKRTAFFSDISPDKAGVYTCKAENWAGVDYMTVDLVVLIPPEIIPDKLNISVNLGETIVLPCNASGIPEPVVSWVKAPHMEIFGNEDKYQILGTSLAIKKVAVSDDGFYRCIAKSEAGQAIGLRRIDTNFPTKGFKKYWVECDENGVPVKSTTFVPARGDIPQDTENYFHWDTEYMQHQEMPENGTDGRFYACLPSHRNGRGPRRVPINTLPHFVETPLNTVVNLGAELRLHCSAMGSPTPAIFWLKNGHLLDEFRSMDGSSVLHLRAHNSSIIGEYVCVARNLIGESRAVATVRIGHEETKSQPVLRSAIKPSKDLSASKPVTVLNCFNGTMAAQNRVIWRNKGRRISQMDEIMHSMNNGSLVLHYFASDEELSHFDCKIHDITGQVQHTGELEVMEVVPRALIRPTRIYTHPMRDIIIDCKLKTGNPLTTRVQWSKNNVNLESDFDKFEIMPNNSLIIRSVMDPDRGSYKCRSWNSHGKSWDDVDLIIEDLPESVVGRLSGSINGHEIQETHANMVLADMEPQLGSNDILMQIDDLPKNVAKSGSKATKTIISIMKAPITQLGYDPDGPEPLPTGHKHRPKSFERLTHYSFQSGEKMRVKQQNRKDESSDGSMPVDVNFDGDVPNIDEDEFTIDPLEEDLVEESPGKITGYGKSAVNFGKNRRVAFKWEDQITYDSSANDSTPNQQIEAGSTMHIQARANLENDSKALRLQVKVDRFGSCPEGYSKIRDICRDVNECTMVDGICASEAECRNTFGGFECQRVCAKGYQASADGECIDIDECSMGMDECDPTTECLNTEGSYECIESCADGFYHNTENICEDINECQLDDPCTMPMFCENLLGSYKCLCPAGFPLINDTCQGISMDPMKPLKLFEYSAEPEEGNCPSGFTWNGRESLCADVDECAFDAPCQYECSNKAGAFECSCPDGYVLNESGQCTDINECDIDGICEEGELCFNQLGTHSCMRSPCPHRYRLDYKKAQCVPLCRNCTEIPINLHMLAVPRAMSAGSPLIRLSAYDAAGRPLRHTNFEIQEERKYVNGYFAAPLPFYLRTVHGRATLHNQNRLLAGSLHKIPIRSSSKEGGIGHAHKYQTNYLIFVAVSKYPF